MADEKWFKYSCSWNLSKGKTFSPANRIARKKHNGEKLELYICVFNLFDLTNNINVAVDALSIYASD